MTADENVRLHLRYCYSLEKLFPIWIRAKKSLKSLEIYWVEIFLFLFSIIIITCML